MNARKRMRIPARAGFEEAPDLGPLQLEIALRIPSSTCTIHQNLISSASERSLFNYKSEQNKRAIAMGQDLDGDPIGAAAGGHEFFRVAKLIMIASHFSAAHVTAASNFLFEGCLCCVRLSTVTGACRTKVKLHSFCVRIARRQTRRRGERLTAARVITSGGGVNEIRCGCV